MAASGIKEAYVLGLGMFSSLGEDVPNTWTRLVRGETGVREVVLRSSKAAEIRALLGCNNASDLLKPPHERMCDMAKSALLECISSANLSVTEINKLPRVLLIVGVSYGDIFTNTDKGIGHFVPQLLSNLGLEIDHLVLSSACSSSNDAIAMGARLARSGDFDLILAGGVDAVDYLKIAGHLNLGTQSNHLVKPFDAERNGTNFGEGSAFICIKAAEPDDKKVHLPSGDRVSILWEMSCSDIESLTAPDPEGHGAERLLSVLAKNLNQTQSLVYINAHGSGTPSNDQMESACYARFFQKHDSFPTLISSTKGALGHTLGATGAMEAIVAIKSLTDDIFIPTIGLSTLHCESEAIQPRLKPQESTWGDQAGNTLVAANMTFGFGGANACTLFGLDN